jgi:hypothetical protein
MSTKTESTISTDAIRRYFRMAVQHAILVLGKAEVRRIVDEG